MKSACWPMGNRWNLNRVLHFKLEFSGELTMKKLLLALMLALVSIGTMAEWILVGRTDDGAVYVDLAIIHKADNKVRMWDLKDFQAGQGGAGAKFLSKKTQLEYDCKDERFRRLGIVLFRENMGAGAVVDSYSGDAGKWQPVQSGSLAETLREIACAHLNNK